VKFYCHDCHLKIKDREDYHWHKDLGHILIMVDENNQEQMKNIAKIEEIENNILKTIDSNAEGMVKEYLKFMKGLKK